MRGRGELVEEEEGRTREGREAENVNKNKKNEKVLGEARTR